MLRAEDDLSRAAPRAVRFATPDSLEAYVAGASLHRTPVSEQSALEEAFFLGLRLMRGVDLKQISTEFGEDTVMPSQT